MWFLSEPRLRIVNLLQLRAIEWSQVDEDSVAVHGKNVPFYVSKAWYRSDVLSSEEGRIFAWFVYKTKSDTIAGAAQVSRVAIVYSEEGFSYIFPLMNKSNT